MSSKMADSQTLSLFPEDTAAVEIICGADEAGRGPIAGPVYAAAVVLDPDNPVEGLKDSKKLSEKQRDALAPEIKQKAKAWAIASCTTEEIDQLNIPAARELMKEHDMNNFIVHAPYIINLATDDLEKRTFSCNFLNTSSAPYFSVNSAILSQPCL